MIDYPSRYRSALLSMVRDLLDEASESGLPGDHAFYLTFRTEAQNVGLSPTLRDVYPETMTVVLQHQFWDLVTDEEGFSVTLRFGGRPESLFVPWHALASFVDPVAEFGFEFPEADSSQNESAEDDGVEGAADETRPPSVEDRPDPRAQAPSSSDPEDEGNQADVVSFDRFRDARQPKDR